MVFSIDIALKFNVGYYKRGIFIDEKDKIIRKYIKREFWTDFIPLIFEMLCSSF